MAIRGFIRKCAIIMGLKDESAPSFGDARKGVFGDQPVKGHIYCLSNPSMPGLVYIGSTSRPLDNIMKEINKNLGEYADSEHRHMENFALEWCEEVEDLWSLDTEFRRKLDYFEDPENTTYFRCSPKEAHETLATLL